MIRNYRRLQVTLIQTFRESGLISRLPSLVSDFVLLPESCFQYDGNTLPLTCGQILAHISPLLKLSGEKHPLTSL